MTTTCTKCHDTGWLPRRFYTDACPCSACQFGAERARFAALSEEDREAEILADVARAKEARHTRRAARRVNT
jgi:hypothetical protein